MKYVITYPISHKLWSEKVTDVTEQASHYFASGHCAIQSFYRQQSTTICAHKRNVWDIAMYETFPMHISTVRLNP